jgi:hypothetical protein
MTYHGGPAFPLAGTRTGPESSGMTLRDYFAAAAMQGLLANGSGVNDELVAEAFMVADAMLVSRERKTK